MSCIHHFFSAAFLLSWNPFTVVSPTTQDIVQVFVYTITNFRILNCSNPHDTVTLPFKKHLTSLTNTFVNNNNAEGYNAEIFRSTRKGAKSVIVMINDKSADRFLLSFYCQTKRVKYE